MPVEASTTSLKTLIEERFPGLWGAVEAVLSTVLAMLPDDVVNPPTCILMGPSSGAKTTTLEMVGEMDGLTYRSDRFTPKAFVSHAANVKREDLAKIDLLPRLKHKALITPELATMFRGDDKALTDTFSILTAVLDGHGFIGDSGTQGRRGYTGDYLFAWLGATTPLPTHVWKVMAQLGSRLFFYEMPDMPVTTDGLVGMLTGKTSYRDKVMFAHELVKAVLVARVEHWGGVHGVRWNRAGDPPDVLTSVARYAALLAQLRGVVSVWRDQGADDFSYTPPNVEKPLRAAAALYNLARGRALLYGRSQLVPEDLALVAHVALSSMPTERARLFRALLRHKGAITTTDAAAALTVSRPTAMRVMQTLAVLGVAEMTGGEPEGYRLTLRLPEWAWCLEPNTVPAGFQGTEEAKSPTELCVDVQEVNPWMES